MTVVQENDHLQAVVENGAIFFLGDGQEDVESRSHQIQTPVEVHCSVQAGFPDHEAASVGEQSGEEQTDDHQASEGRTRPEEARLDVDLCDQAGSSQRFSEDVCCETAKNQGLLQCLEDTRDEEKDTEPEDEERETPAHGSVFPGENDRVEIVPQVKVGYDTDEQAELEGDLDGVKGESGGEDGSLHSSNESIVKVTDEESVCDEAEESLREELGLDETSSMEETLWSKGPNILDLHINGYPEDQDGDSADGAEMSGSLDTNSAVKAADLTENSDFSILEASGSPGLADKKYLEEDEPLPGDCANMEAC